MFVCGCGVCAPIAAAIATTAAVHTPVHIVFIIRPPAARVCNRQTAFAAQFEKSAIATQPFFIAVRFNAAYAPRNSDRSHTEFPFEGALLAADAPYSTGAIAIGSNQTHHHELVTIAAPLQMSDWPMSSAFLLYPYGPVSAIRMVGGPAGNPPRRSMAARDRLGRGIVSFTPLRAHGGNDRTLHAYAQPIWILTTPVPNRDTRAVIARRRTFG